MSLAAVFDDVMPITKVSHRMERDFGVRVPESTIRFWIRQYASKVKLKTDYDKWIVRSFSGVLCIDEVYQGKMAILLVVDSNRKNDRLIAYELVDDGNDSAKMQDFLARIKKQGINPDQVVTDGSTLYPEALANVWPKVPHQLCLFHQTQLMVKAVSRATKEIRKKIPDHKVPEAGGHGRVAYLPKAQQVFFEESGKIDASDCQNDRVKSQ